MPEVLNELFTIKYRGFAPVTITNDFDWFLDGEYPKNLVHHVMSLRWILGIQDLKIALGVMESWIRFHNSDNKKSKFYRNYSGGCGWHVANHLIFLA